MDVEKLFLSQLNSKENILLAIEEGITEEFFYTYKEIFKSSVSHFREYGVAPDRGVIAEAYPNFEFEESEQPVEFFIGKLKEHHKKRIYKKGLEKIAKLLHDDVNLAEIEMQKILSYSKRTIKVGQDLDLRTEGDRMEDYRQRKVGGGLVGLSSGWPSIDSLTAGFKPGELSVMIAEPKKKKSWALIYQAHNMWRNERVPVLFLTREMSKEAIRRRFDAIEFSFPWDSFKKGTLSPAAEKKYQDGLKDLSKYEVPFYVLGYSLHESLATVSSLVPKVEKYLLNGGVLFVDGIYLLDDDRGEKEQDWKAIVNIARDLKDMAQTYRIPILATSQAKIEGKNYVPNMENIAYGKYVAQYADYIFSISENPKDKEAACMWIHLVAQREGDAGSCLINADFSCMDFTQREIKRGVIEVE